MEQVTKDDRFSFGFLPDRVNCTSRPSTFPVRGPDGLQFSQDTDSIRLENGVNMDFSSQKFMIAIWFKSYFSATYNSYRYGRIISWRRYDQYDNALLDITQYHDGNDQTNRIFLNLQLFHYTDTSSQQGNTFSYVFTPTKVMEGWQLLSLSFDSSVSQTSKIMMRLRNLNEQTFKYWEEKNYVWRDRIPQRKDIYVGAPCELDSKGYAYGNIMTLGKIYIWKNLANILTSSDSAFDKFFFRAFGQPYPNCTGLIPCKFCSVGYPLPTVFNTPLQCQTENADQGQLYMAKWEFDEEGQPSQYILDSSPHNRDIVKLDINQIENDEPIRIYGQGYWFYNKVKVYLTSSPPFSQIPQFTIEMWVRRYRDQSIYTASDNEDGIPVQIIDSANSTVYYKISLIKSNAQVQNDIYRGSKQQASFNYPGFLQTDNWHYVSVASSFTSYRFYKYYSTNTQAFHTKIQVDNVVKKQDQVISGNDGGYDWPLDAKFIITNQKSMIYKSLRILGYDRLEEDSLLQVKSSCSPLGTQPTCNFCPASTGKCYSKCDENQYGNNCDACHFFCGHCKGPLKSDCTYCSRTPATSNVIFNPTFGNCTCTPGRYYNETTDKCELCDANCIECYGGSNAQCLTCAAGKNYFPQTSCVDTCDDVLVKKGTNIGFYPKTEVVGGVSQSLCLQCHPYCAKCTSGLSSQCQACQSGYVLLGGNTCTDTCPDGYYPNFATNNCDLCDISCLTCTKGTSNDCLLCKNPVLFQQSGKCKVRCDEGFYGDSNQVCQKCHPWCGTCTTKFSTDCGSCAPGYFLQAGTSECQTDCPVGYYGDTVTHACLLCHYSCTSCSGYGADTCIKCAPGFLRNGALCVTKCDDNQFIVDGECKSCDPKCTTCYGLKDNECYQCAENLITNVGYFFFNNSCREACPDGQYQDNFSRECKPCNPVCETCISDTYCTKCIDGPYQLNNGECTYFTCLDNQYRATKPQLACFECDKSCLTCQGKSQFDCLSCRPKQMLVAQQCLTCDQQPGMTEPSDDTIAGCVEICGDGFNYGSFQCDDGNVYNGDGCSAQCTVEPGFACSPGSKTTPSVCVDNKNPTPRISLVTQSNMILIEFDEEVQLQNDLDSTNLNVKIQGPQGDNYKFEWRLKDEYKTSEPIQIIGIQLSIYQTLKGSQNEKVVIQFLNPDIYKDQAGNGMIVVPMYSYLNKYDYIDPETKAKLDSAGDTSMLATFGAVAINLAISLVFGGSISAMWTMVNTIQLISLFPLCNIKYPAITILVFEKMLGSHGESTIIPNLLYDKIVNRPGSNVELEPPLNSVFEKYGWTISNFIYLSGRKILMWTGICVAYPFVWYMKRKYANKHKFCKLWVQAEQKFRYTLLLRGVIMSYVSMYLAFILGIFQMSMSTMENTLSAFMAIAFGLILTYLPILLINILQKNYEKINSDKFMLSYSTVVKEVDLSHPIRYMYYPVFLLRRAVFAIQLVLFANRPKDQIIFMSFTSIVMILYVAVIKPQKEKIMIILTAVGEALILFLHLFSLVFLDEDLSEEKQIRYGWFIIIVIGLYILTNWILILTITLQQLRVKYKERQVEKAKLKEKSKEDMQYKIWKRKKMIKNRILKEQKMFPQNETLNEATQNYPYSKTEQMTNLITANQADNNSNAFEPIYALTKIEGKPNDSVQNLNYFYNPDQMHYLDIPSVQSPGIQGKKQKDLGGKYQSFKTPETLNQLSGGNHSSNEQLNALITQNTNMNGSNGMNNNSVQNEKSKLSIQEFNNNLEDEANTSDHKSSFHSLSQKNINLNNNEEDGGEGYVKDANVSFRINKIAENSPSFYQEKLQDQTLDHFLDNKVEVNNGVDQSMNNGNEDDGLNEFVEKRKKKKNKSKNRRKSINTKKSNAFEKQNW